MKSCFGLLMLVVVACSNPSSVPMPQPTIITPTTDTPFSTQQIDVEELGTPTSFVPGFYTEVIPCNDCRNITRKILFLEDHRFHMKDEFNGKDAPPVETEGRWQTSNDQLQLLVSNMVVKRFAVTNKGLSELSLTSATVVLNPDSYLTRKTIGADNIAWMEKKSAGIDFFALGNEPFWLMEIDKDKQISFLQVDSSQPAVFPYVAAVLQNGQYIYNIQKDSASMQIIITPQFCSDGMSDNWYEYKVEAKYNGVTYLGCGVKLNGLPESLSP
ncbi:MAG TPA: copper resistance protein NlpE N-terminal domain-containing protein [Niastella sp.]